MAYVIDTETVAIDGAESLMEAVTAPSNYKDEAKIAAYIAEKTKERAERAALYPYTARIVALGVQSDTAAAPTVWAAKTEGEEADLLRRFWATVYQPLSGHVEPLVTFNGLGFDLPLLMVRSRLLGVDCPELNLDRYRTPHVDLMERLTFRGAIDRRSLKWFAARFGLTTLDPIKGSEIPGLVAAGDWKAVAAHCASDVKLTHALARRLGVIQTVKAVA
jgi:predicted PolB exonuclease-like 3'-5' exonuclease